MATHTVVWGDTLSELAVKYNTTVNNLVKLNNIKDPDFIVVGQVLKLDGNADPVKKTTSKQATVDVFGLQSGTDRTVYASWTWTKDNTEEYQVRYWYSTGDGVGFVGQDTTTKWDRDSWTAPENATHVTFYVKPIAKKHKVNGKDTAYWTADWSTEKKYYFKNNPPSKPSGLSVEVEDYTLTARLDNLDINATHVEFQVFRDDTWIYKTLTAKITTGSASVTCSLNAGSKYKVRCRGVRGESKGEWSDYSSNYDTPPSKPSKITAIKATSETSVYLEWDSSKTAKTYEIEYTTKKQYFDGSDQTTKVNGIEGTHYEKTGLESGQEYFFRVRAVNDDGESGWSEIKSVKIGEAPTAPTTWSSTTKAVVGETVILYWVHNSKDNSKQTKAEIELTINGETTTIKKFDSGDEDEEEKTHYHTIDTTSYTAGATIKWRVRTAGITGVYNDDEDANHGWSVLRTIDVDAPATLELSVTDSHGFDLDTVNSFPFYIHGLPGPNTQMPLSYHVEILANKTYETVDSVGNIKIVSKGEAVYSRYFDTGYTLIVELSAGNVNLDNNIPYIVRCTVSMDSGLTATSSATFTVEWSDNMYEPNAEIGFDPDTVSTYIRPFCVNEDEQLINGVVLSVYRREFDGSFTELATNINNMSNTFVTDPHPALDYARYRIVATTKSTGAVSYTDLPGYPIDEKAVIIQWDEDWSNFDATLDETQEQPSWAGSLLRLPYNIDISDNNKPDVSLIEYIGREHPVSYYGTHLGNNSTWNVVIEKNDEETLYALRRLARWMGDVYVREPSGSGYWANVTVSFSQKHLDLTIPVTLDIVRVEGGV